MAQLALAVAGSVIGNAILPGLGGQIGFALGSLAGGYLAAPDVQGPRLAERTVQISSYGAGIAEVWGGGRLAGNVIWSTDLIESESSESAGKGGPEVTTYSYSVSCAVAICEGPIGGIRRIWADAKLVYDAREGSDAATQAASSAFAGYMTVYTGSETQMPDATIEAIEGAGNVEAYRGTAYVVFAGLPLADYGNRVPNFTFEITTEPATEAESEDLIAPFIAQWGGDPPAHFAVDSPAITEYFIDDGGAGVLEYTYPEAYASHLLEHPSATTYVHYTTSVDDRPSSTVGGVLDAPSEGPQYVYLKFGPESPDSITTGSPSDGIDNHLLAIGAAQGDDKCYFVDNITTPVDGTTPSQNLLLRIYRNDSGGSVGDYLFGSSMTNYPPEIVGPDTFYPAWYYYKLREIRAERDETFKTQACISGDPATMGIAQLPGNASICINNAGTISPNYAYTETAGSYKQLQVKATGGGAVTKLPLGQIVRDSDPLATNAAFWNEEAASAGISGTYGVDYPVSVSIAGVGEAVSAEREAGSVPLSQIVSDLCVDAGLLLSQIDVSELDDVVLGYQRTRVMPARAAIEPLRQAFFFDAVESGAIIKFVKRGGASIATLGIDDLGANTDAAGEPIEHERGQETEAPDSVAVAYQSPAADYQVGVQRSNRRAGGSQQITQIELPIVLEDLTAAQVSDVLLYEAWSSRTKRRVSVTQEHAYIEPTDIITLSDDQFTYRVRVVDKVEGAGVIRLECVDDDASSYVTNSTPGVVSGGGSVIRFDGPTALYLLDIPILRDADDGTGYYAAATGYRSTWRGARAFRSINDGASYSVVRDMTVRAIAGLAETELQAYVGGNTVDETNTVNVTITAGTLSSITRAELLSGGNACVLGDEVLQFQRAQLLTGTTYRLSGLLRGRVGTEQHMDSHSVGERFVLLSEATTYRINAPETEINQASVWKAVTLGDTLDDAFAVDFTNTAAGAKPLAPVHLVATSMGGSPDEEWALQWVRRTRIGGAWRDLVDAQLGESSEGYVVTVARDGATVSTQTVSTPSAVVIATAGDVISVAQMSAIVGPGFAASITLT